MELWQSLLSYFLFTVFGGVLAYWFAPWVAQKLTLRRELAAVYLKPFRIWCADFFGECSEFIATYIDPATVKPSPVQIIADYRDLHEIIRYVPKWMGKIQKERDCIFFSKDKYEKIARMITELQDTVDEFWHGLQHEYGIDFQSSQYEDAWIREIISTTKDEREQISMDIEAHINSKLKGMLSSHDFQEVVFKYLKSKIPKG
ncbi:hypothetical protein M1N93_01935 [Dehalococcoidia bacterium]|nr:hypothetical protein [Dehalococcoidia bacterium]